MNKKLTLLLSVLLILTFLCSISVFATSEEAASTEDITAIMDSFAGKFSSVFDGGVTLEGFSIKLRSSESATNGLRSISSFDWNKNAAFELDGYSLCEFGAIAVSKANYEAAGSTFTINAETGALEGVKGKIVPVWKGGKFVGNTLGTQDGVTQFALTAVNFTDNFDSDVYFCAYSIYELDGEPIVTVVDYPTEGYEYVNLYQLTLDMYVNGAINSSNTDDTAVWDTLLTGVVTLTSSQYGTGATDMDGNAFGDTFTFKDVYNMGSGTTVNEKIKITLLHDRKTGEYVAIWRGSGEIPNCSTGNSQFKYNTSRTQMTHPKLTQATSKKITTFVFDSGITGAADSSYFMSHLYVETYVFPKTFTSIGRDSIRNCYALTTVYQAEATGYMQENEAGLADFSFFTGFNSYNNLYSMSSSVEVEKIHFPSKHVNTYIGAGTVSCGSNTRYKNLVKVWCGDTPEPEEGVIDLTGMSNLTAIYGSCFAAMSASIDSYICILPDGCRLSRSNSNNAFFSLNVTEVRQATYNANVVTDIAAHKYGLASTAKYCDLSGKEHPTEENTLRILAIGNSFSEDAMWHLYDIANNAIENGSLDYEYVSLGNLRKSSCSLDTHWSNIQNSTAAYNYYTNTNGTWSYVTSDLATALAEQEWDVITIQQESGNSGMPDSYTNLANIVNYVNENKTNENAKIYWHMTWAYQNGLDRASFANYDNDQTTMYSAIVSTVQSSVITTEGIAGVIPSGTAIQNARSSYVGDTLTRDGYHLSYGLGRYIAAMTWFNFITGVSLDNITWVPEEYKSVALYLDVVKESVNNAIATPYAVTASSYTETPEYTDEQLFTLYGLDFESYTALDLTEYTHFQEYYQSVTSTPSVMSSGTSTATKYIGIGTFDKTTLPVGSVIILDSGYQYRPEGWVDESTLNTSRPDNVTENFVVTDEAWWGSFTIRGFNLAYKGGNTVVTEDVADHFRIYIPA